MRDSKHHWDDHVRVGTRLLADSRSSDFGRHLGARQRPPRASRWRAWEARFRYVAALADRGGVALQFRRQRSGRSPVLAVISRRGALRAAHHRQTASLRSLGQLLRAVLAVHRSRDRLRAAHFGLDDGRDRPGGRDPLRHLRRVLHDRTSRVSRRHRDARAQVASTGPDVLGGGDDRVLRAGRRGAARRPALALWPDADGDAPELSDHGVDTVAPLDPHSHANWSETAETFGIAGSAWIIADLLTARNG